MQTSRYSIWALRLVKAYSELSLKDKTFGALLLDLPSIPPDILLMLRDFCLDNERCGDYGSKLVHD